MRMLEKTRPTEEFWSVRQAFQKYNIVEDRVIVFNIYIRYTCLANSGASEAKINLCSRYVEKSTKCSELKCASSFRE